MARLDIIPFMADSLHVNTPSRMNMEILMKTEPTFQLQFANVLRESLKRHNLTVAKLHKKTGVPTKTIYHWLAGQTPKNIQHLGKVAFHLNLSLEELLFGISTMEDMNLPLPLYQIQLVRVSQSTKQKLIVGSVTLDAIDLPQSR
jgi:transcriptional regulator with XRE-family HTH domain